MAEEIAKEGKVNVRRPDREFLLNIHSGNYDYDELVELANQKTCLIDELYQKSSLPDLPDFNRAEEVLIEIRNILYNNEDKESMSSSYKFTHPTAKTKKLVKP